MKKSTALRLTVLVLGSSGLAALFIMGILSNLGSLLVRATPFPINMHSSIQADYSKDPEYLQIPPMDIQLVIDTIWDQNLNSQNLSTRLTQVNDNFISSVASVTPQPSATNIAESQITATLTERNNATESTLSSFPTPTETPAGFVASATPTAGSEDPTMTPLTPTATISIPTNTVLPPTNTVSPCGQLSISNFSTVNKKASWKISNNSSSSLPLNSIILSWPSANGNLSKIFVGTSKIWDSDAAPTSTTIHPSGVLLPGNTSKFIEFFFLNNTDPGGYNLTLNLNGCLINKSN